MKRHLISAFLCITTSLACSAQVGVNGSHMPEHGFLAGKKFTIYPTVDHYDFKGLRLRIDVYDDRQVMGLKKVNCSDIPFTNTSEFESPDCIFKISEYLDTLFHQAGAVPDEKSAQALEVRLEAIDVRLIGMGKITPHGLCQMHFRYKSLDKVYCIDITDRDEHSPLGPNAFVTRKTATRIMASAAMREVIEQFFADLKKGI